MSVPWFERMNFCSAYSSLPPPDVSTTNESASTEDTVPAVPASTTSPVSIAARRSIPVPISGSSVFTSGPAQRDPRAPHFGPHQRPVGVVVLEERDHRRGHRPDLLRRDVHEVDVLRL